MTFIVTLYDVLRLLSGGLSHDSEDGVNCADAAGMMLASSKTYAESTRPNRDASQGHRRLFSSHSITAATLLAAAVMPTANADILSVQADGTGDYKTVQDAIDAASDSDVIELGDGVFTGPGNRDIRTGGKAVTIRSASGDPEACTIDAQGSLEDLHRVFLFDSGEGADTIIQSIRMLGGFESTGGGAFCTQSSSPTFSSCVFEGNDGFPGGGLFCGSFPPEDSDASSPLVQSCVFRSNTGNSGGGLMSMGVSANPTVIDCDFIDNVAGNKGGGIACSGGKSVIQDCRFSDNSAADGGAIFIGDDGTPTITACLFVENTAAQGGAVCVSSGGAPKLVRCVLYANHSTWHTGGGGAVFATGGKQSTAIESCSIVANTAIEGGGGIHNFEGLLRLHETIVAFNTNALGPANIRGSELLSAHCVAQFDSPGVSLRRSDDSNFSADPLFCDLDTGDLTLEAESPCLPGNHPNGVDCGLIGAFGHGCGVIPTVRSSWGLVKSRFVGPAR